MVNAFAMDFSYWAAHIKKLQVRMELLETQARIKGYKSQATVMRNETPKKHAPSKPAWKPSLSLI
jgi:hypothetical protein